VKLTFTLERDGGQTPADLLVVSDATATVGALADHLASSDPGAARSPGTARLLGARPTLRLGGVGRTPISRATRLVDSGLLSGSRVALVPDVGPGDQPPLQAAAVVTVSAGPDVGREYPLAVGSSVVGRGRSCEVRLTDPLVSRQHARVNVGDTVELIDMGSSNGIVLGEESVERVVLRPGDKVRLGESVLMFRLLAKSGQKAPASTVVFNRPPRLDRVYVGAELPSPEPPEQPRSQRFPILPLFAPLVFGVVFYLATKSLSSLLFVAMSPLLIVANSAESRISGKKNYRVALAQFRADISSLLVDAGAARDEERGRRLDEHPSSQAVADAALSLGPLLWSRWPDLPGFAEVRIGVGTRPSRNRIVLPTGKQNNRELWRELGEAVAPFATVDGVPVVADLAAGGALGVAGRRSDALGVARSLVVQLACLHSPAELVIAGMASPESAGDWEWVKWLPHCLSGASPLSCRPLASGPAPCGALLAELGDIVSAREAERSDRVGTTALPAIVVVVEDDAPVTRSAVVDLARRGSSVGVHFVWVAGHVRALPAVCRVFVDAAGEGSLAGFVHEAEQVSPLQVEPLDAEAAERVARHLACVVDASAPDNDQSDLPRSVALLTLVGTGLASSPHDVIERWNESQSILTGPMMAAAPTGRRRPATLRAIVGETASGPHVLDLRSQGPHALVGGTTGSGKSELLQSWIVGMALSNSPQRLTFLLVDYKGGSAFADCLRLPHTVGLVTDLSPHLVRRALTSLSAELKYREDLLHRKSAKDLGELERRGDPEAPPSLVIVVDEFAALVQEVPDFVDGVVNVAQRGRSLGLHLILATQRPAGVIKDNLRANTNLRLALRVADAADSTDVLGTPDAAAFDPSIPGRAVSRTGPAQLVPFQAAYAGGWTSSKPAPPSMEVASIGFGPEVRWDLPLSDTDEADTGPNDIARIVANVDAAAALADIPAPRLPWLPELASVYDLARLPTERRDDRLVFAVVDHPESQDQPTVAFHPDTDGNLAVYGTGNSGKSTLLRTLAVAAGFTVRGGPCHVYGLDFGSRGLAMIEDLPHVGSVIAGSDYERVGRLLDLLRKTIDERSVAYARARAGTISEYRRIAGRPEEPRVMVLVDGMGAFRSAYEGTEHAKLFEKFIGIAADGRPVGVHFVIAADRPGALPVALAASVQRRLALRMADPNDYSSMGMPADVLDAASPPGRGIFGGFEVQVAVLGKSADTSLQARELEKFGLSMGAAGVRRAPRVECLADRVLLADLPKEVESRPTLGLESVNLAPIGFEPRGTFSIAGPPASGRSTALLAVVSSLRRWRADIQLAYVGNRRSSLADAVDWQRRALDHAEAASLAADLPAVAGECLDDMTPWVLVVEGLPDFVNGPADFPLGEAVKSLVSGGHLVVSDGEPAALSGSYPLLVAARSSRNGIVLQPEQSDAVLFRSQFPRLRRADFPAGRGLLVPRGGQPLTVQVALP